RVIAPTRWKLRTAVAKVNRVLAALLLEQHPDKTFIGRAERGLLRGAQGVTLGWLYITPLGYVVRSLTGLTKSIESDPIDRY
ncbi:MAG: hypothetical protein D3908_15180, partial [Candidatus Electrothrix sp. AUS4]|nr:hypothetical protein [Candidatus Electrothrix sp. AUS4]